MFFPTLPRHGSPVTMVRFAASRREGTRVPPNQSSDVEDDGFQHSSNRPETSEAQGFAGILKKTFSGFTLPSLGSGQSEEPAESSVKPRRARFEQGNYLRKRIPKRTPTTAADSKTTATSSKAKLDQIGEDSDSDGRASIGDSLFTKSAIR